MVISKEKVKHLPNKCNQTTDQTQSHVKAEDCPLSVSIASVLSKSFQVDTESPISLLEGYSLSVYALIRGTVFTIEEPTELARVKPYCVVEVAFVFLHVY